MKSTLIHHTGTFDSRSVLNNTTQNVKECATKCLQMYADEYEEIPHLSAGNIAALSGLKVTKTGDTLLHSSDKRAISLFPIPIPPPVFVRSVEALSQSDESKLEAALASLVREDPSVSVQVDPETGQTLLSGMGELHIDIVSERLLEQYKVKCKMGPVSIAYRESLFGVDLSQDVLYEKESLGKKTKLGIQLTITNVHKEEDSEGLLPVLLEPNQIKVELNTSNVFIGTRNLKEQSLSQLPSGYPSLSEIQDALKAGVHNALNRGPLARYPLTNLIVQIKRVALYGHDLCSKGAVRVAVYQLIQGLLKNLNLQLFEPMMKVKLRVPDKYTGQVTKDLSGHRRGHIQSLVPESEEDTTQHSICLIEAHVPLSEMLGYAVHLRSTTAGNASFTMELCGFGVIQGERQDQVLKQLRGY